MSDRDLTSMLQQQVQEAAATLSPIDIRGGASKAFLKPLCADRVALSTRQHCGIIRYQPVELVITVRAGTTLGELRQALAENQQMLAFEPPEFSPDATIGGTVATGLSGPGRAYYGAVRDFLLGCRFVNGRGEVLRVGGEVMKNVAGFDIPRLMCGAYGSLGVLLDLSFKVLPLPDANQTLVLELPEAEALQRCLALRQNGEPVTASFYDDGCLYLRFAGTERSVTATTAKLGGLVLSDGEQLWRSIREQQLPCFDNSDGLWRLSLPTASGPIPQAGVWEWGGCQRWLKAPADSPEPHRLAQAAGGNATLFRTTTGDTDRFTPLEPKLAALHQRIKQAFDPAGILPDCPYLTETQAAYANPAAS